MISWPNPSPSASFWRVCGSVCVRRAPWSQRPAYASAPSCVTSDGIELHLTPKEFDLLGALAEKPGRVLTHRMLLTRVWGPAHVENVPYLRVFIGQLRQKIEVEAAATVILTEPGIGYRGMGTES